MSAPDQIPAAFKPLPARDGEPAFEDAWQAQVLALAFTLAESGLFSPAQWSETLGAELARASEDGAPDTQETYYLAAQSALEKLIAGADPETAEGLDCRVEQWRRAYLNTPHGQPVELKAGLTTGET